jgi:hypothetical protein
MSIGIYAAAAGGPVLAAIIVGASAGVMVNLKITGPMYSLPIVALLYSRFGVRATFLAVVTALMTASLPFVIFPNVALEPYLLWVRLSAGNGLVLSTLRQNIEWALFFLLPILLSRHAGDPPIVIVHGEQWMLRALLIGMCGVVLAASKPGATASHLVPFLPVIFYLTAAQLRHARAECGRDVVAAATGFVVTLMLLASVQQASFIREFAPRTADHEADDIREFLAVHPADNVEMGYGREERLTLARPLTVFHDNSYFIDSPAVQEHQLDGLDLPPAAIQAVRNCAAEYWLIPQGQPPFSGPNRYPAMHMKPLFSEEFRRAFADAYALAGRTQYYDVWACRTRGAK